MGGGGEEEGVVEEEKEVEEGEKEVEMVAAKNHLGPEKSVTVPQLLLQPPPPPPPPSFHLSSPSNQALACETAGGRRCWMRRCERKCVHAGGDAAN